MKVESAEEDEKFWGEPSYHTPEDRVLIAKKTMEREEKRQGKSEKEPKKYVPKLFNPEGKPYNINQPKIPFRLNDEDDRDNVVLEVQLFKYVFSYCTRFYYAV